MFNIKDPRNQVLQAKFFLVTLLTLNLYNKGQVSIMTNQNTLPSNFNLFIILFFLSKKVCYMNIYFLEVWWFFCENVFSSH